jgi:signal transduction histidine kinase
LVKKEAEFEKLKIKKQLSQNLHDDLAATISSIGFYITLIKFSLKEKSSQVSEFIQKSESLLKDATDSITDMIWSFNAQDDSLENILFRLQNNFKILFQEMQIDFKIDWKTTKTNQKINHNTKQNIYLILKEILNNILKYSEASKVSITVNKDINNIIITVADNGKGFDLTKAKNKGNGLKNIQNRAIDFNGNINIDTAERKGTKIKITVPISEWHK